MYKDFCLDDVNQANTNRSIIQQRWPHPGSDMMLPHPIYLAQHKLDAWAKDAVEIAELLSHKNTHSEGLPELNHSLQNTPPDCFSVDFAITQQNGELSIKLIEAQAFPSVMNFMLDFEDIFSRKAVLCGLTIDDRKARLKAAITLEHRAENVVMLDENIAQQSSAPDFMSSSSYVSPRSILDIYPYNSEWMHWRDDGPQNVKRVYNRSIFHTLNPTEQAHILALLKHNDITFFNHPAWYYKVDKASLGRIKHWSIPNTFPISNANKQDLSKMVLKHPNGFGGKEVFISPSKQEISEAPLDSILQERIEYAAFHPSMESDKHLCVELRFMLLREQNNYTPITTLARATFDGNLMRHRKNKLPGEGYTCAIGIGETKCSV